MDGGEVMTQCLLALGARRVYGVIGTTLIGFTDALYDVRDRLRYVSARHEQVAVSMADAEGRITGRPGVVALHAGPGVLNGSMGLAIACKDSSPLIALCANIKRKLKATGHSFDIGHMEALRPLCRAVLTVRKADEIPAIMAQAFTQAMSGPRGPVAVEVPEDVWFEQATVEVNPSMFQLPPPIQPRPADVDAVAQALASAKRPLLLAGGGIARSGAAAELLKLAEAMQAPVVTTGNGRGTMPEGHPLCYGRAGFAGGTTCADYAVRTCDLIVGIGAAWSDLTAYEYTVPPPKQLFLVVTEPSHVSREIKVSGIACADAKLFLSALLSKGVKPAIEAAWRADLDRKRDEWQGALAAACGMKSRPPRPAQVLSALARKLSDAAIVTVGAGTHLVYANDYLPCRVPNGYLASTNFGAMGFGLAAALGAKLAAPKRQVVAVVGDGDFMMQLQDLETAVREDLDVTIVVLNDNAYRTLALRQKFQLEGRTFGVTHSNPDFVALAKAFRATGFRFDDPETVEATWDNVLSTPGPRLCEVVVDAEDIPPTNMEAIFAMA